MIIITYMISLPFSYFYSGGPGGPAEWNTIQQLSALCFLQLLGNSTLPELQQLEAMWIGMATTWAAWLPAAAVLCWGASSQWGFLGPAASASLGVCSTCSFSGRILDLLHKPWPGLSKRCLSRAPGAPAAGECSRAIVLEETAAFRRALTDSRERGIGERRFMEYF